MTWLAAVAILAGCATTTRHVSRVKDVPRTEQHAVPTASVQVGPPSRVEIGDVAVSVDLLEERSQLVPAPGDPPAFAPRVVLRVAAVNRGTRVRDFDMVVAFPKSSDARLPPGPPLESFGEVRDIAVQPGVAAIIEGARRQPVRLYPGIEVPLFLRLAPGLADSGQIAGFVGLFEASGSEGAEPASFRFPVAVAVESRPASFVANFRQGYEADEEQVFDRGSGGSSYREVPGTRRNVQEQSGPYAFVRFEDGRPATPPAMPAAASAPAEESIPPLP